MNNAARKVTNAQVISAKNALQSEDGVNWIHYHTTEMVVLFDCSNGRRGISKVASKLRKKGFKVISDEAFGKIIL